MVSIGTCYDHVVAFGTDVPDEIAAEIVGRTVFRRNEQELFHETYR